MCIFDRATDSMFGTRAYTPGALYQVPRKIPVRIEPKTYFGELTRCLPFKTTSGHRPQRRVHHIAMQWLPYYRAHHCLLRMHMTALPIQRDWMCVTVRWLCSRCTRCTSH